MCKTNTSGRCNDIFIFILIDFKGENNGEWKFEEVQSLHHAGSNKICRENFSWRGKRSWVFSCSCSQRTHWSWLSLWLQKCKYAVTLCQNLPTMTWRTSTSRDCTGILTSKLLFTVSILFNYYLIIFSARPTFCHSQVCLVVLCTVLTDVTAFYFRIYQCVVRTVRPVVIWDHYRTTCQSPLIWRLVHKG